MALHEIPAGLQPFVDSMPQDAAQRAEAMRETAGLLLAAAIEADPNYRTTELEGGHIYIRGPFTTDDRLILGGDEEQQVVYGIDASIFGVLIQEAGPLSIKELATKIGTERFRRTVTNGGSPIPAIVHPRSEPVAYLQSRFAVVPSLGLRMGIAKVIPSDRHGTFYTVVALQK